MSRYVIDPPPVVAIPVEGGGAFPVRRIYCVGRNYADHAREMGGDPDREAPFFFSKPRDAAVCADEIPYPPATRDLHHEVELVLALKSGGADIPVEQAMAHVYGAAVGVDLTRRDLQAQAKKAGRPWTTAKGFDGSAPMGPIRPGAVPERGEVTLSVDGETRQAGDLDQMVWRSGEIIAHLSRLFRLEAGDLVFTGTPAGVGAVEAGQKIEARIADLPPLAFTLSAR
ncbi:fumarylacetoacetate hydrolase [Marinicauda salina]|uniref:Fumarylacetoacetate hydrolase n=1 Tax=Marinicauda salina TaxID=2135793 RepID=A0A2U2BT42_9PROT|nr:fumarylacetoacetate hydrolase family protein [Marinicauda salina]PWE17174.1 fumarylacetoacetate hydrolase [Marinicauda salina]